jgi:hypothetical protein
MQVRDAIELPLRSMASSNSSVQFLSSSIEFACFISQIVQIFLVIAQEYSFVWDCLNRLSYGHWNR